MGATSLVNVTGRSLAESAALAETEIASKMRKFFMDPPCLLA
jgi:hypothetical protein